MQFSKIFILFILFISFTSAEPITLSSLDVEAPESVCINNSYDIIISPLNLSGDFVEIDFLDIEFSEDQHVFGPFYKIREKYKTLIKIKDTNSTFLFLNITAEQGGKYIINQANISIVDNCKTLEEKLDFITKIETFFIDYWPPIVATGFLILAVFIVLIIYKLAKS